MPRTFNKSNFTSIAPYQRIEQDLRRRIKEGEWATGMMIPSRRALATEYAVELPTVQRAISGLLESSVLRADPGRGTFVTGDGIDREPESSGPGQGPGGTLRVALVAGLWPMLDKTSTDRNPGSLTAVTAIERACGRMGGSISNYGRRVAGENWEPFEQAIKRIDWSKTDAAILVGIHDNIENVDDFVRAAQAIPVPSVCLTSGELPSVIPHVFADNSFGGFEATRHLITQGYEQFTYLAPFRASWGRDRLLGARKAITQYGLPEDALTVYPPPGAVHSFDDFGFVTEQMMKDAAYQNSQDLIRHCDSMPAMIAMNDAAAWGYILAAREHGLEPGLDYAIVGFDNSQDSRQIGLTSVQPPWETMAEEAIRLLFAAARGQHVGTQVRVCPHLVPRSSTATPYPVLRRNTLSNVAA